MAIASFARNRGHHRRQSFSRKREACASKAERRVPPGNAGAFGYGLNDYQYALGNIDDLL